MCESNVMLYALNLCSDVCELFLNTIRKKMENSESHRQKVAKSRLETRLFLGLNGAPVACKENTCLIKASGPL